MIDLFTLPDDTPGLHIEKSEISNLIEAADGSPLGVEAVPFNLRIIGIPDLRRALQRPGPEHQQD